MEVKLSDGSGVRIAAHRQINYSGKKELIVNLEWDAVKHLAQWSNSQKGAFKKFFDLEEGNSVVEYKMDSLDNATTAASRLLGSISRRHKSAKLEYYAQ